MSLIFAWSWYIYIIVDSMQYVWRMRIFTRSWYIHNVWSYVQFFGICVSVQGRGILILFLIVCRFRSR